MPAVSVILPTCDRPTLWPRALQSILAQGWQDLEVLLVDSNRRCAPVRMTEGFAAVKDDPRVVLVERPHMPSASGARNAGLAVARGDWIAYLDDDDLYRPEKIERQLSLARQTGAPIVLCGYTVVLPRRRRTRQVSTRGFEGDGLLNAANWGTPMLFHRRDSGVRFDERLRAGEDEVLAHAFLLRHGVKAVPNWAESLVLVHPKIGGARVHRGEAVWQTYRANRLQVRGQYSREAVRRYLAMGRIVQAQNGFGGTGHFVRCARAVLGTRGAGGWRLVANAAAHRFGLFRSWVVS